jgi:hypothetical protein
MIVPRPRPSVLPPSPVARYSREAHARRPPPLQESTPEATPPIERSTRRPPPLRTSAPIDFQSLTATLSDPDVARLAPSLAPPPLDAFLRPEPSPERQSESLAPVADDDWSPPPPRSSLRFLVLAATAIAGGLGLGGAYGLFTSTNAGSTTTALAATTEAALTPTPPPAATAPIDSPTAVGAQLELPPQPSPTARAATLAAPPTLAPTTTAIIPAARRAPIAPEPLAEGVTKTEEPAGEETVAPPELPAFDVAAARAALAARLARASQCEPEGGGGIARALVTFAPSGRTTQTTVSGAGFAGSAGGSCVAAAFAHVSVPPFSGGPVSVGISVPR